MKELMTQEVIHASPSVVWEELTDFSEYPNWNDFIKRLEGKPLNGSKLRVTFKVPDKKGFRFFSSRPFVFNADPEKELRWVGSPFLFGFVLSGEHYFILRPLKDGSTEFIHGEKFNGIIVPIVWDYLTTFYRGAMIEFNRALKKRCESTETTPQDQETSIDSR